MEEFKWFYLLYLIVGIPVTIYLFYLAKKVQSLSITMFGSALFSFLLGILFNLVDSKGISNTKEWGDLIAITLILCGLFVRIRESKPIFARFPLYLTFLPIVILFFYPFVADSNVVKILLKMILQGGALLTSLLLVTINQYIYRNRLVLLISIFLFLISYTFIWIVELDDSFISIIVGKIVFVLGIILFSIGLRNSTKKKN